MRKTRNMSGKWADKWKAQINTYYDTHPKQMQRMVDYCKGTKLDPKKTFREDVLGNVKKGLSVDKAIKKTLRTHVFQTDAERLRDNAVKGLRGFKDAYEDWRKFTRHQKINKENFRYLGDNTYEYDFDNNWFIYIQYTNSPEEAKVWRKHK